MANIERLSCLVEKFVLLLDDCFRLSKCSDDADSSHGLMEVGMDWTVNRMVDLVNCGAQINHWLGECIDEVVGQEDTGPYTKAIH